MGNNDIINDIRDIITRIKNISSDAGHLNEQQAIAVKNFTDAILPILSEAEKIEFEKLNYLINSKYFKALHGFFTVLFNIHDWIRNQSISESLDGLEEKFTTLFDMSISMIYYEKIANNRNHYNDISKIAIEASTTAAQAADAFSKINDNHKKSNTLTDEMEAITEKAHNSFKSIFELVEESQALKASIEKIASETGIVKYHDLFQKDAAYFSEEANSWKNWLNGAIIMTIIIAVGFIWLGLKHPYSDFSAQSFSFISSKIIVFAALFYFISVCFKNYKACKHNQVINKHRQHALSTFDAFTKSGEGDPELKKEILREITKTIFASSNSAYNSNNDHDESPSNIFNIIKQISDNGKSS